MFETGMIHLIISILSYFVNWALQQIPPEADLGDALIDLCLSIIAKAVTLTETDADDELYEKVATAIRAR
jgi:hypothetical protein